MNKVVLDTGASIRKMLTRVIDEGIKASLAQRALTEKDKQEKVAKHSGAESPSGDDVDSLFGGGASADGSGDDASAAPSKTMDDEQEKLKSGNVEPADIIEKLNSIRGGKSFKDEQISGSLDQYIGSLSKAEKVALMAFLKGIAQIVTGEIPADKATEPAAQPSDVSMKKSNLPDGGSESGNDSGGSKQQKVKTLKPSVVKSAQPKKHSSTEDTTAPKSTPAPITPKRR